MIEERKIAITDTDNNSVSAENFVKRRVFNEKLKKIRINNTFVSASKINKDNLIKSWSLVENKVNEKKYDSIAGIINDIEVLVVGDYNIIFLVKYNSLLDRIYDYMADFEGVLFDVFSKKYKIVFLNDAWMFEKNNYIKNLRENYKYEYIEEIDDNSDNESDDINKIVSLLG